MSLEPIGILTLLLGVLCLALGQRFAAGAVAVTTLLGSAAAILVGSANIQPAHLLLGFLAMTALTRKREGAAALRALSPGSPGFWVACLVVYGVMGSYVLPRVLAGTTEVFPVGTSDVYGTTNGTIPLGPVTGNVTQSIYLVADLACFAMVAAVASTRRGFAAAAGAVLAYAAANVAFAVIDLATYATGTQGLLDFVRNAQYAFHLDEEVSGLKRIAGSFSEASSFAHATLGAFGFVGTLWLCGRRPALTGALAVVSIALIVMSTSSTGLVGTPPMLCVLYVTALRRCGTGRSGRNGAIAILAAPLLLVVGVFALALDPQASHVVSDYLTTLVFEKGASQSGLERATWNAAAWSNLLDTRGIGVGLGSGRASSFALALLSNVGIPGTIAYGLFAWTAFGARRGEPRTYPSDVRLAARNACLGLLMADVVAGALVDQGLIFYVLAALACAEPERGRALTPNLTLKSQTA